MSHNFSIVADWLPFSILTMPVAQLKCPPCCCLWPLSITHATCGIGVWGLLEHKKIVQHLNFTKYFSSTLSISVFQSFSNFAQWMAVLLPCSVQNYKWSDNSDNYHKQTRFTWFEKFWKDFLYCDGCLHYWTPATLKHTGRQSPIEAQQIKPVALFCYK